MDFKVESLSAQLREKQNQYEGMLRELKDHGNRHEGELSELRITSRIKTEEVERLKLELEDRNAETKGLKSEAEMLKDKIAILRSEFFKAEAKSKDDTSELKAKVVVLEEKLKNYEHIEQDIDNAVMGFGSTRPEAHDNFYLGVIQSAPTSTQRRVQQAITLAQKLNEKQQQLDKVQRELQAKDERVQRAEEELAMTQELLSKSKHPSGYLVETLQQKEKELLELRQNVRKMANENDALKQENGDLAGVGLAADILEAE